MKRPRDYRPPKQPAWDIVMECRHGRMPYDPSPPCSCFPVEVAVVRRLPKSGRRPKRKAA